MTIAPDMRIKPTRSALLRPARLKRKPSASPLQSQRVALQWKQNPFAQIRQKLKRRESAGFQPPGQPFQAGQVYSPTNGLANPRIKLTRTARPARLKRESSGVLIGEETMIRKLILKRLDKEERSLGESVDYVRHILRTSLPAFFKFALFTPLSQSVIKN